MGAKKGWTSYFCKSIANALLKKPWSAVLILYRCWAQICTNKGWGSSNSMGIREMLYVCHGSPNIIVVTDHKPLKGYLVIEIWTRSKIRGCFDWMKRPWDIDLPSSTAPGSGTVAHFPASLMAMVQTLLNVFPAKLSQSDIQESNNIRDIIKSTGLMTAFADSNNIAMISPDIIHAAGRGNPQYEKLISVIQQGFSRMCNLTAPEVCE